MKMKLSNLLLSVVVSLTCITYSQASKMDDYETRLDPNSQPQSILLGMPTEVLAHIASFDGVAEALAGKPLPDGVSLDFMLKLDPLWAQKNLGPICVRLEMARRKAPSVRVIAEDKEQILTREGSLPFKYMLLAFPMAHDEFKAICNAHKKRFFTPFILMPSPLHSSLKDLGVTPLIEKNLSNSIQFDPDRDLSGCNAETKYIANMTLFQAIEQAARSTLQKDDYNFFMDMVRIFGCKNSGLKVKLKISQQRYNQFLGLARTVAAYAFPADTQLTEIAMKQPAQERHRLIASDLKRANEAVKREMDTAKWSAEHGSVNAQFNNALSGLRQAMNPTPATEEPLYEVDFKTLLAGMFGIPK